MTQGLEPKPGDGTLEDAVSPFSRGALQLFVQTAPDSIVVVDEAGRIVIANKLTERMFGYTHEELIGQSIELLVPARYRDVHVKHRHGYFASPKTRPMGGASASLAGRKKDGTELPVEISLSPMHTQEGLLVTAAIRDISERKKVEDQLRRSLKEKEVLLKEIHHRVKNNLQIVSSMLSLQMGLIQNAQALGLFKESQARVHSIALFHEKLYQSKDLAHVDMAEYLRGLTTGLFAAYGVNTDQISLFVGAHDTPIGVDAAISCGLITNELVSNSLKHAFPTGQRGVIRVLLRSEGPLAVLEVSDDGVGMPAELATQTPSTLGLRLVTILVEQLRGSIDVETSQGTRFIIRFEREEHV